MKRLLLVSVLVTTPVAAHAEDVAVLGLTCQMVINATRPEWQGEVKNTGSVPLGGPQPVRIIATFRNASGAFVSVSEAFLDYNPLLPGQVSPFSNYGNANPTISNLTVVLDILNPDDITHRILTSSGLSGAICTK